MTTRREFFASALGGMLALLGLGACGKKGDPKPPPGKPATYPRQYPSS